MKLVLLAGGSGTRGRPYTDYIPKAMYPVCGRPVIRHIAEYAAAIQGISEVIVLTDLSGLGGQIANYFGASKLGKKRLTFVQDSGAGTGGDLLHLRPHLRGEEGFVLWFADNLCAINIKEMIKLYKKTGADACVATRLFRREETGFAVVQNDIISKFVEKPKIELPMAECLGIYVLKTSILNKISAARKKHVNLSYDILEKLAKSGRVCSYDIGKTAWLDAESPVYLERNHSTVKRIVSQMKK